MFYAIELPFQMILLGMEAHSVIGLRMRTIASGGPAAIAEMHKMTSEKVFALAEALGTIFAGGSVRTVIGSYRAHVRANEMRLRGSGRR